MKLSDAIPAAVRPESPDATPQLPDGNSVDDGDQNAMVESGDESHSSSDESDGVAVEDPRAPSGICCAICGKSTEEVGC